MRNLSYRETFVCLVLIAAAALSAHQLWFAPALAQTERDQATIERLLVTLAQPPRSAPPPVRDPAVVGSAPELHTQPLSPPITARPVHTKRPPHARRPSPNIELACADDSKDPLCGALGP